MYYENNTQKALAFDRIILLLFTRGERCVYDGIYTLSVLLISRAVSTLRSAKNGGFFTLNLFDRKQDLMVGGGGGEFRYVTLTIVYSSACHTNI